MPATTFTCPACGAVLKRSAPPAPGKKLKCPECEEIVAPAESAGPRSRREEKITSARGKLHPQPADDEDEELPRPRQRRRKGKPAGLSPAVLWGSIGAGALVLLLGGIGVALALRGPRAPEATGGTSGSGSTGGTAATPGAGDAPIVEPPWTGYKPSRLMTGLGHGNLAPDLQGLDLAGKSFKLSDYRGKVVLIDFWGHWNSWCQKMYPYERTLGQRLAQKPFALLGVNGDQKIDIPTGVLAQEGLPMRCWFDGPNGALCAACCIQTYPSFLLLDHRGVIRFKHSGFLQNTRPLDGLIDSLVTAAEAAPRTGPGTSPEALKPAMEGFAANCMAADIEGPDLDGKVFTLEAHRGQVVVLWFWELQTPFWQKLYPYQRYLLKRMKGQPFALLGVNTDRTSGEARAVLDKEEIAMRCWFDDGKPICRQYGIERFPTVYVIDHRGVIRYRNDGLLPDQVEPLDKLLTTLVTAALADPKK
jgi:peroxiredoxin